MLYMTIDPDFPKNHNVVGKHSTSDGAYSHFVWGPGRKDAESSTNKEVQKMPTKQKEKNIFH